MGGMGGGVLLGGMDVGSRCFDYVCSVLTLVSDISIIGRFISGCPGLTLQLLHLQTKLASPRLPDCSFFSKRETETQFGCISRHEVHCTLNV